jgi:hypothetical protein
VDRLVADQPFIANLDPQSVEENQGIDGLQRACLPGGDLLEHRVGDRADQIGRNLDPQLIAKYQRRFPGFDDKILGCGSSRPT